ncbi:MAG: hypothetical protein Q9185_006543 [Variospora sp. 1 TL-2023]
MPSKRPTASASSTPSKQSFPSTSTTTTTKQPTSKPSSASSRSSSNNNNNNNDFKTIATALWKTYTDQTPQRTKLLDAFMAFLVALGGLQFAYCVLVGNYPFNAFLAGFGATVGQFVLTAGLRMQTDAGNRKRGEFENVGCERSANMLRDAGVGVE